MLSDAELQLSLTYHEGIYTSSPQNLRVMLLSSKAAILEVCGWVEQAMDAIVLETAQRCALSPQRIAQISDKYVKPTSGFSYKNHFEKMIISVVGYKILEQAESNAGAPVYALESTLDYLAKLRNHYAHTHFDVSSPYPKGYSTIPNPSVMKNHATTTNLGLAAIEAQLIASGC
ncbi:MAG: hypothetical protein ACK41V_01145 [Acidovorax sp.]|uniref:hypothetical protein n=1 Tax=Acidovorax sp. TaxID=1872122 RepID=UPI0039187E99